MSNPRSYIYEGFWTDWSHGPILGKTLTLPQRNGSFLLVFLAIYVTIAATSFRQIISFILHQHLTYHPDKEVDGLHSQRQAIFRNTKTAAAASWELLRLGFTWKAKARSSWLRSIPFGLLALANLVAFAISSIFVSQVASGAGDFVLIRSPYCGYHLFPSSPSSSLNQTNAIEIDDSGYKSLRDTTRAAEYAKSCYGTATQLGQCNNFVIKEIPL